MTTDQKTAFYFRHRPLIEDWAALRANARTTFDSELRGLGARIAQMAEEAGASLTESGGLWSKVGLTKPAWREAGWDLSVVIAWNSATLLERAKNERPYVGVLVNAAPGDLRAASQEIRERCMPLVQPLGWTERLMEAWPVWGWIGQPAGSVELSALVDACQTSFEAGWSAVHNELDDVVR